MKKHPETIGLVITIIFLAGCASPPSPQPHANQSVNQTQLNLSAGLSEAQLDQMRSVMQKYQIGVTTVKQFEADAKSILGRDPVPHDSFFADGNRFMEDYNVGSICDLVFESDAPARDVNTDFANGSTPLKSIKFFP